MSCAGALPLGASFPCPTCGAGIGEPCRTICDCIQRPGLGPCEHLLAVADAVASGALPLDPSGSDPIAGPRKISDGGGGQT